MTTFTINKEIQSLIKEGASKAKSATALKKKAAEELAAQGARGEWFSKAGVDAGHISKETLAGVQGLIASGLLDKAEFALWSMDSKAAKAANRQDERNALTSEVNKYLASFRAMIETAWRKANPDAAKAQTEGKADKEESDKEEPVKMAGDVRKVLRALILEVAGMDCQNRDAILEHLNAAEAAMTW
jgi:hypothetical protein